MKLPFIDKFLSLADKQAVLNFAEKIKKETTPDTSEKTMYATNGGYQSLGGLIYNPDLIPIDTYQKMRIDGQINMGLQFIKLPIIALDSSIDCEDEDIEDAVYNEIKRIYRDTTDKMLRAVDYGFSAIEKVWEYQKDTGLWGYKKLKDPDISTITLKVDEMGNFMGFRQTTPRQVDIDPEKAFVFTHRLEHGNLYGIPRTKPAYPYYFAGELMLLFTNRYMERSGDPFKMGRYPPDPKRSDGLHPSLDAMTALGTQIKGGSFIALPNTRDVNGNYVYDIEIKEDSKRTEPMFVDYQNFLNAMKLRSIIIPERSATQDTSTGSYGMSETHSELFFIAEDGLVADVADYYNRYLIPQYVRFNFGENAPKATLNISSIQKKTRAFLEDIIKEIIRKPDTNPDTIIDVNKLRQELGLPEPKKEEPAIPPSQAEHSHRHNIQLDNNKFWRKPTEFEEKIDFEAIDDILNDIEDKVRKDATEVIGWIKESAIRYLEPALNDKNIPSINNYVAKYKNDYGKVFKDNMQEAYNKGIDSIIKEFKVKVKDKTLPREELQTINAKADTISWQHLNTIEYRTIQASLSGLDNQKTAQTIILDIRDVFSKFISGDLEKAIKTEFTTALNRGRSYIAGLLAKG
jgi:hypothetical protein